MSSGIVTPQPLPPTPVPPPSECEIVIDQQLQRTRRQVKGVDIAGGLIALAIGILAYLLVAAMIDHWLIVGGLGFWGRLVLWLLLVVAAGAYFVGRVLPPLLNRIHPLFAAATIEQSEPSLKNSLINFLLLRGQRQDVAPPIYQAMEYRAAADLSKVRIDAAVDRTQVIRLGCVLLVVVALFSLYLVLSPKNPIRSAARILWPWSAIEAPTRVTIHEIRPGDAIAYYGDSVIVSAELSGLRAGEPVVLVYSTADGQSVDQVIPMTQPEGDYRFQCRLPAGNLGLQQDHAYYLAAGDCRTRRYRIAVQISPAIVVDKVSYHYPAYTGLPDRSVERQGDLQAIEGTEATLHAAANVEIKRGTAEIDLGCTGHQGLRMSTEGRTALGQLTLRLDPRDISRPEYNSYQLRFADVQGRDNQQPIRHRIEVIRDLPPDVQLVEPREAEVPLALSGKLPIKTLAEDPDFGLRRVRLRVEHEGRSLRIVSLLEKRKPEKAWPGAFTGSYTFEPARLGLKAGDRVEYWAEAEDNKEPTPGQSASRKQWITIVGPDQTRQSRSKSESKSESGQGERPPTGGDQGASGGHDKTSQNKTAGDGRGEPSKDEKGNAADKKPQSGEAQPNQRQQSSDQQRGEQQADSSRPGQGKGKQSAAQSGQKPGDGQASGQQQLAQNSEKPKERIDPETNPGDAVQEILNDRKKQEQPPTSPSKSDQQQSSEQSTDNQQRAGEQQQSGQQQAGNQQSDKQSQSGKSSGQKSGEQKSDQLKSENPKAGEQKLGDEKSGGEKSENLKSGEQSGSQRSGAKKGEGEKQGGEKMADQQPAGEKGGNEKSSGGQGGEKKQGGQQNAAQQPAGEKGGNQQPGTEKSAGEKHDGELGDREKQGGEKTAGQPSAEKKAGGENAASRPGMTEQPPGEKSAAKAPAKETPGADTTGGEKSGTAAGGQEQKPKEPGGDQALAQKKAAEQQAGSQPPGAGKNEGNNAGSPAPQQEGQTRQSKPSQAAPSPGDSKGDMAQSSSASEKPSDSKGETAGDRSGGGQQGGGQRAQERGVGSAGSHTSAEEGGGSAPEQGQGETGNRAGNQAAAKKPVGSDAKQQAEEGTGSRQKPSGEKAGGQQAAAGDKSQQGGTPGQGTSKQTGPGGTGNPGGGQASSTSAAATPPEPAPSAADQANLEYARRQTTLALEYLRDQLAKEKPPLLEQLGWSKDDARRFLQRWEQMQQAAAQKGQAGQSARQQFHDALRSLGLRPHGSELRPGSITPDQPQNLHDAGRFAPPADWAEQFRQYTRGVAGKERQGNGE
jgi:hypothetical protein